MKPSVIRYKELTWPVVAVLPHDIPLVLPLGDGYDDQDILQEVKTGSICLLPALPYGWQGSLVDLGPEMLRRLIDGIWSGPKEGGFTQLFVCHAGGHTEQHAYHLPMNIDTLIIDAVIGGVVRAIPDEAEEDFYHRFHRLHRWTKKLCNLWFEIKLRQA